jgi:alpha-N-acetylglucosaminidase
MDRLLGSQTYFLVGKWIADARGWGADATEANYFESNARDLLTSWGDRGNMLTDYANRTLSGLVGSYYKGRWELFFDAVEKSLDAGEPLDEPALTEAYKDWEYAWWHDRPGSFPSEPVGDGIALARQILAE